MEKVDRKRRAGSARKIAFAIASLLNFAALADAQVNPKDQPLTKTQIVLLGTGNPFPDPDRSGPATAIVVNGTAYLVDFGAGVVRQAKAAMFDRGMSALEPTNLRIVFVTHLHSDHTVGYPDLIFTPWVMGRKTPLEVYGPKGMKAMTDHVLAAWQADVEERIATESWQAADYAQNYKVNVHEIAVGVVYKDANITVTAFPTKHVFPENYGYRFDTADRSIVISGDTSPSQATIDACNGCDVLIHEVQTAEFLARRPTGFQSYSAKYHTSTTQLAELAGKAKPRLLILYHASIVLRPELRPQASSPAQLLKEITAGYSGEVVVGRDLDVY
jgi:ribonuclease BN (tRNA processing enzyme)